MYVGAISRCIYRTLNFPMGLQAFQGRILMNVTYWNNMSRFRICTWKHLFCAKWWALGVQYRPIHVPSKKKSFDLHPWLSNPKASTCYHVGTGVPSIVPVRYLNRRNLAKAIIAQHANTAYKCCGTCSYQFSWHRAACRNHSKSIVSFNCFKQAFFVHAMRMASQRIEIHNCHTRPLVCLC